MSNTVWPSIHANIMRLTRLNQCGVPVTGTGSKSKLVTDGVVKISLSAEYEDGEDTTKKNGAGKICVQHKDPDQLKYLSPEIEFCGIDPEAYNLITGQPLVTDHESNAVGLRLGSDALSTAFALEVWTDVPGVACETGSPLYGYWLIPFIGPGRLSDIELAVSAAEFTLSSQTKPGSGWAEGPYLVVADENPDEGDPETVPSKLLEPIKGTDHIHFQATTIAPPSVTAGAVDLIVA